MAKDDTLINLALIAGGGYLLFNLLPEIKRAVGGASTGTAQTFEGVGSAVSGVGSGLGTAGQGLGSGIGSIGESAGDLARSVAREGDELLDALTSPFKPLKSIFTGVSGAIDQLFTPKPNVTSKATETGQNAFSAKSFNNPLAPIEEVFPSISPTRRILGINIFNPFSSVLDVGTKVGSTILRGVGTPTVATSQSKVNFTPAPSNVKAKISSSGGGSSSFIVRESNIPPADFTPLPQSSFVVKQSNFTPANFTPATGGFSSV